MKMQFSYFEISLMQFQRQKLELKFMKVYFCKFCRLGEIGRTPIHNSNVELRSKSRLDVKFFSKFI